MSEVRFLPVGGCSNQIFTHNVFRKFRTLEEAREFAFACEVVAESSCEAEYLALRRRSEVARHLEQGQEE